MGTSWEFGPQTGVRWSWICTLFLLAAPLTAPQLAVGATHGEEVTAAWLLNGRVRRSVTLKDKLSPERGEILVTSEGRRLILEVERNRLLLSPGFTETHYTAEGERVTVTPNHTEHCYYHGWVRGSEESSVALSTCEGISGLIVLDANNSFYLQPLAAPGSGSHMLYRTEHLPIKGGGCGHGEPSSTATSHLNEFLSQPGHHRMKRNVWGAQKFMELYIVADHSMYMKQNMDLGKTKQRAMEIANFVDKFYMAVNIKVALIGLEVWTAGDQCEIRNDANYSLRTFLAWKQKLRSRKKHDNAQLITGATFQGTTIGMAPLEGMCTAENSGGVSMDHSELAIGAAATMAHEIGHNFGMSHDKDYCCKEATPDQGGCIMAAATGHPFPRKFSSCSQQQLRNYFAKGGGMCLFNMPNTDDLVMGKKCGNGFLEEGEQCDCGEPEECTNPCCNAKDCTLKEGAQCAHGECCYNCKLKAAGTQCREKAGGCDLPEFCRGDNAFCPANVYMMDGSSCAYGEAYCMNGMCLTHMQQCVNLWGSGARPAPDICFIDVNKAGDRYGNCGKDTQGGNFVKCKPQDAKCGKIQCQSSADKPKQDNTVSMDTTINIDGYEVKCRGAHSYSMQEDEGDSSDPGLVMTGTKCGDGMVCQDRQCKNASFIELEKCLSQCNGHGVCNSNKHCHCHAGWAPPYCDKSGQGGSEDSGPVPDDFTDGLIVFLLLLFLVVLPLVAYGFYYWYRKPNSQFSKWLKKSKAKCRMGNVPRQQPPRAQAKTIFTQRSAPPAAAPQATQKSSWSVFHGKSSVSTSSSQPVNIVRPLHPPSSQTTKSFIQLKPSRPPPPAKLTPFIPAKQENQLSQLLPPKKPLPTCPVRTPQLNPPRKPLPGNPIQKKDCLLVMTPANSRPPITQSATQSKGHHRPKPGSKVQAAAAAFQKQ
ncbi:disintegrin and metalloproteinase domain-containing protein 33-like isoform X1 [Aquarana catesbeiana]|uniref:disintegrin and metalloproteinase domain-containing protein 33-like isoform X1 n=1 Tax=Aquarana catesbeiana TaxID=8400 RepID=UPI003CCA3678